ncbi:MAG: hypothetical protein ACERKZ_20645 [Lachnotalea sp.]
MTRRKSLKLATAQDVRKALSRVANMVLNGELDSKSANSIILACNAILSGIRTDEQQKKIDELEKMLNQKQDNAEDWKTAIIQIAEKRKQIQQE